MDSKFRDAWRHFDGLGNKILIEDPSSGCGIFKLTGCTPIKSHLKILYVKKIVHVFMYYLIYKLFCTFTVTSIIISKPKLQASIFDNLSFKLDVTLVG